MPSAYIDLITYNLQIEYGSFNLPCKSEAPEAFDKILQTELQGKSGYINCIKCNKGLWEQPNQRAINFQFNFPSDYPVALKHKLNDMWQGCRINRQRESFANMYHGIFQQVRLPSGENLWDDNWQTKLGYYIEYNIKNMQSIPSESRAARLVEIEMLKELYQNQ